jgi:periplasmic protein CpxP/Spy
LEAIDIAQARPTRMIRAEHGISALNHSVVCAWTFASRVETDGPAGLFKDAKETYMKNLLTTSVLAVTLSFASPSLPSYAQAGAQSEGNLQALTPEQVVDRMDAKLHLSPDQKAQISPVIAARQQKLAALREDTSSSGLRKLRKMKGIFADSDKKIEPVLNDQQKQQYAQMREQMKEDIRARAQSGGASYQ